MKKINPEKYSLNTPIHIELTIKELLNISYAASHAAPDIAGERIAFAFSLSPTDKQEIIGNRTDPLLYQITDQCRQILAECGYEYNLDKDEDWARMYSIKENQSND